MNVWEVSGAKISSCNKEGNAINGLIYQLASNSNETGGFINFNSSVFLVISSFLKVY